MNNKIELDDFNTMLNFATGQVKAYGEPEKIEIELLKPFPNHKFKLYTGKRLEDMIESIEQYGVIVPIVIWKNENEFIILSGHNRVEACKKLGLDKIPCVIKEDLTMEEATLIVTETNFMQRSFSDLSHSERAYTLEQHYKALKCQGKRNDLLQEIGNLMKNGTEKSEYNIEKVGNEYSLSKNTVARYMRLATLNEDLLYKVDDETLPIRVGYNISFIEDEKIQSRINSLLNEGVSINIEKAEKLKNLYKNYKLNVDNVEYYLKNNEEKPKRTRAKYIKIRNDITSKYFDKKCKQEEIEDVIDKALEMYFNSQN